MINHTFNPDQNHVLITVTGENTLEEFKEATIAFRSDSRFSKDLNRICDFSQADLSANRILDVLRYLRFVRRVPTSDACQVALIGHAQRDVLLMFANAISNFEIRHFTDIEAATEWVNLNRATTQSTRVANQVPTAPVKLLKVRGQFSIGTAIEMQKAWIADPDFDPRRPVVWDLRGAEFSSNLPDLTQGAKKMDAIRAETQAERKVAAIVRTREQEVMLKHVFQEGVKNGLTRIFLDEQDAVTWVLTTSSGNDLKNQISHANG